MVSRSLYAAAIVGSALCGAGSAHAAGVDCAARLIPPAPQAAMLSARTLIELRDFGGSNNRTNAAAPFAVSPDRKWIALILRRAAVDADLYCHGVLLVSAKGTVPPRLLDTGGDFISGMHDTWGMPDIANGAPETITPLWSPDGRTLAYLRRDDGITQAWLVGLDGAPAHPLTRLPIDVRAIAWSRDGRHLLVTSRPAMTTGEQAIAIEGRRGFHFDNRFWPMSEDRPKPALPIPLQVDAYNVQTGTIATADPPQSAKVRTTMDRGRPPGAFLYARSNGGSRAWTIQKSPDLPSSPAALHVEVDGRTRPCPDSLCANGVQALWWTGPKTLLFLRAGTGTKRGRTSLYRWRIGGDRAPAEILDTDDAVFGCQTANDRLYCAREQAKTPRSLTAIDVRSGKTKTLFDPNPDVPSAELGRVQRLRWTAADGVSSYGDFVLPPGHRAGQRHPLIVVQYESRGFLRGGTGDEVPIFLLAARGYAVLSLQRPGELPAATLGHTFAEAQRARMKDFAERRMLVAAVNAGVDTAIAQGVVYPARIGLTGLSDGAATAQFILAHQNSFKAAALSSCCDEPSSTMFAVGPGFRDLLTSTGYPAPGQDGQDFWREYSLAANVARMRTPLLLQVADREYRFALETFNTLQVGHAPIDMYVFPDEHHVKWHPLHRFAIYNRILAWFDFWLRDLPSNDPAATAEIARWQTMKAALTPGQ